MIKYNTNNYRKKGFFSIKIAIIDRSRWFMVTSELVDDYYTPNEFVRFPSLHNTDLTKSKTWIIDTRFLYFPTLSLP